MTLSDKIITTVGRLRENSPRINLTNRSTLIHNLLWMYQVMCASESLMEEAIPLSPPTLATYLRHHLEEERNHDEWLADDLVSIGVDVEVMPLNRNAVELAGTQYYLIKHVSPVCLLGYMAVLEGFPFPVSACDELETLHGKKVIRCLRYHAENDIEHRKELFRIIDKMNNPLIFENAIRTQYLIDEAFRVDY
jgi:hypothetical protein